MEKKALIVANEIIDNGKPKKIKVRTLMKKFGFLKRTTESSREITELLSKNSIYLNPSIMKIGDVWKLSLDDRVTLSYSQERQEKIKTKFEIYDYNNDEWFDKIETKALRTEREVETKFIIPLLERLGYSEDDRYDGMTFKAFNGSRPTILETDFSLFDAENDDLDNQVLLVVEAKKEYRITKEVELMNAQKQTKSYAIWLSCHFGLVTDGRKIQILDLFPNIGGLEVLFECYTSELKKNFGEIYNLVGKPVLVSYYENVIN